MSWNKQLFITTAYQASHVSRRLKHVVANVVPGSEANGVAARGSGGEGFPRIPFPYVPDRLVWKGHAEDRF
ncbi:hypothetical protein TNCV_89901 [Trichonephila clavipes]|nr:hypothetical protein TNCV_89901 [Trichonephila clavipes]